MKRNMRSLKKFQILSILLVFILIISLPIYSRGKPTTVDREEYDEIVEIIESNYFGDIPEFDHETRDVDKLFKQLDKNSIYFKREDLLKFEGEISSVGYGIGLSVVRDKDGNEVVTRVYKNSPACDAGIKRGDKILSVNAKSVSGLDYYDLKKEFSGKDEDEIRLRIYSREKDLVYVRNLNKRDYFIDPIYSEILEIGDNQERIGYISIERFSAGSADSFKDSIEELYYKEEIDKIVLDLRDNPGGILEEVTNITSLISPRGPISYIGIKNRNSEYQRISLVNNIPNIMQFDLVVLINENSASGSELLAAAVKETGAGKVVGTKSYGKGSMQETFLLENGNAIKITIAEFFSPKNNRINQVGVTPQYVVENMEGEDLQLQKALELLLNYK